MDRRKKALKFVNLAGRGLEIGPSYNPLVSKASGARVETVDHADRQTLVDKYTAWGLPAEKTAAIEEVDHIWTGGSLLDVVTDRGAYDFIVASHVIEHSVDLVSFLHDCTELLSESGRLALVIPDKRYCFDRFQPLSTVGDAVDAFHAANRFHTAGTLLDHQAYGCTLGDAIAWNATATGVVLLQFPQLEHADTVIESGLAQDQYHDIHHWKFTPTSFELLMRDLWCLGYQSLGHVGSFGTDGFEFFVTLGKGDTWPADDRVKTLLRIELELAAVAQTSQPAGAPEDLVERNAALERQVAELIGEIATLKASRSWRTTRPLRQINAAARQRFRH